MLVRKKIMYYHLKEKIPPELYKVASTAKRTPEENLANVIDLLRPHYNVGGAIINNVTAELTFTMNSEKTEPMKEKIMKANENYKKNIHTKVLEQYGADFLKTTQTPRIIEISIRALWNWLSENEK